MVLHDCKTPRIIPGIRIFKEGSQWKCPTKGCGQVWIAKPFNKTFKMLVWVRKG